MITLPFAVSLSHSSDLVQTIGAEFHLDSQELAAAHELVEAGLPPLVEPEILSFLFGISNSLLAEMAHESWRFYRRYKIAKSSGGMRRIEAPRRFLKLVQAWILQHILTKAPIAEQAHGFVRGHSIFSNARVHTESRNLMVVDIKDFFPSVGAREVRRVFSRLGYPRRTANRLTSLCTLEGHLPQGAPTSPTLANAVFAPQDRALAQLALSWGCKYSRYADDLAFSGDRCFTARDIRAVRDVLQAGGFAVNRRKTRIIGAGGRRLVAGLVLNGATQPLPPRTQRRRWRAMFQQARVAPQSFSERSQSLSGIAAFVKEYDEVLASEYASIARLAREAGET